MKGWVVGSALLGCLVGALSAGYITTKIGRKAALIISAILFTVSALGSGYQPLCSSQLVLLVVFRIIGRGFRNRISFYGCSNLYCLKYLQRNKRGILVSFYQLAVVTGFFVVFLATYYIGEGNTPEENIESGWRWMFWSELIPCSLFLVLTFFYTKKSEVVGIIG